MPLTSRSLQERENGLATAQYVWSPVYADCLILRNRDANPADGLEQRHYVQHDANFNVTAITDPTGTVVERYLYDPYGQATVLAANWQPTTANHDWQYLHQGGRYDPATTLHHFRNRDYSAELGRWVKQDPLGYVDGMNLQESYRSNPSSTLDPEGLLSVHDDRDTSAGRGWILARRAQQQAIRAYEAGDIALGDYLSYLSTQFAQFGESVDTQVSQAYWKGFRRQAAAQWDCYTDCMGDLLLAAVGVGAGLGAAPNIPYVPKVLFKPFLEDKIWGLYRSTSPWGTLRSGSALTMRQFGFTNLYDSMMKGRGLTAARAGTNPIMAHGGSGALRGDIAGLALASIYCSAKCTINSPDCG